MTYFSELIFFRILYAYNVTSVSASSWLLDNSPIAETPAQVILKHCSSPDKINSLIFSTFMF